jgi:hypothetical protein
MLAVESAVIQTKRVRLLGVNVIYEAYKRAEDPSKEKKCADRGPKAYQWRPEMQRLRSGHPELQAEVSFELEVNALTAVQYLSFVAMA